VNIFLSFLNTSFCECTAGIGGAKPRVAMAVLLVALSPSYLHCALTA